MDKCNWFENWFDTAYYHLLYRHRDDVEAHAFIDAMLAFLQPAPGQKALDLACGRGRHSIYLNSKKLDVTGIDLSPSNIAFAKKFENPTLHFNVHDMRKSFGSNEYDFVFNLFTSFGYFEKTEDDFLVLKNVCQSLKPGGKFVIDFLNAAVIRQQPEQHHHTTLEGIEFDIDKRVEGSYIVKHIHVNDHGTKLDFHEKVKLIDVDWFKTGFENACLKMSHVFGTYDLKAFTPQSPRLIIVAEKN